jgi:hypothetical protein
LENIIISASQMKYYEEENSAAMSEDDNDDNVDIESDVSFANRQIIFFFKIPSFLFVRFFFCYNYKDDDLSADGKSRSANNQYFSQVTERGRFEDKFNKAKNC